MKHFDTVYLTPAAEFECPECNNVCYVSLIDIDANSMSKEELKDFYKKVNCKEPPKGLSGHWLMQPDQVKCEYCYCEFKTYKGELEKELEELDSEEESE